MSNNQRYQYPVTLSSNQQGAVLIVVLLFLVLIILAGVIAVKQSTTDLRLSTSDQINTLSAVKKSLKPFMERQQVSIQLFSSLKKQGIEEVNTVVHEWFANQAALDQNDELADTPIDE